MRTDDVVQCNLIEWGIAVHPGPAKTGVIDLERGRDGCARGRAIGLRADLDALAMQEHNRFAHASTHPDKMRACGHDGHTAMLLGAAQQLARNRDFNGTAVLIFQPAEEGGGGPLVEDGLLERFLMEAAVGCAGGT